MILDISSVCLNENREEVREVHIDMDSIESKAGKFSIIKKEPFELHLSNVENKRLLIQGETDVTAAIPCGRCLKQVPTKLHLAVDKTVILSPQSQASQISQISIEAQELDDDNLEQLEYMDGYQLDIDRLVYGEILVGWPMKVLCRDDCKGICSTCGADLNESTCNCSQTAIDPRMAAFQDVFSKFKEV